MKTRLTITIILMFAALLCQAQTPTRKDNTIIIEHDMGETEMYNHALETLVSEGYFIENTIREIGLIQASFNQVHRLQVQVVVSVDSIKISGTVPAVTKSFTVEWRMVGDIRRQAFKEMQRLAGHIDGTKIRYAQL